MNNLTIINENGQLVVTSRQIADDFEKRHADVLEKIEELIKTEKSVMTMFIESSYKAGTGKDYKEYLITRDGFSLLVMGFTGGRALEWKLKYIQAFNDMEQSLKAPKPTCIEDVLIQSLQEMKDVREQLNEVNHNSLVAKSVSEKNKQELQDIREVITLDSNGWREDTSRLVNKIAIKLGGFEHIRNVREESYKLLEKRMGVSLGIRLTNKRRRMAEQGVCKSKRDKLTNIDIIAEDKKLIEGYLSIVKDMAIRKGVA